MMRILSRAIPALALLAFAAPAFAQSANLAINANVNATCRVTTAAPAITINYDIFTPATASGSGTINVRCTKGLTINVAADGGLNAGSVPGFLRAVNGSGGQIGYKLSLAAGGPELALNTATSTGSLSLGKGADVPISLYAALDTAVDPAAGAYTDTVVVTFTAL